MDTVISKNKLSTDRVNDVVCLGNSSFSGCSKRLKTHRVIDRKLKFKKKNLSYGNIEVTPIKCKNKFEEQIEANNDPEGIKKTEKRVFIVFYSLLILSLIPLFLFAIRVGSLTITTGLTYIFITFLLLILALLVLIGWAIIKSELKKTQTQ